MLDDYIVKQKGAYKLFSNQIKNNQISHAYLIDDNNSGDSMGLAISFIKSIFRIENDDDNLFELIDSGNYPELKIIRPDGLFIKKGQLSELMNDFSMSSIYGNKKIYIILDADKMRPEAANSILKFLEEPTSSVIAFLITNNFNNMLSTIVSRCQVVKLSNNFSMDKSFDDVCFNFLKSIENDKYYSFLNEKLLFFDVFDYKNRDNVVFFVDTLIDMYYDILKIFMGKNIILEKNVYNEFKKISDMNSFSSLIDKILFLIDVKDSIKYNVNINLLVDSIIFNIGGNNEYSWN